MNRKNLPDNEVSLQRWPSLPGASTLLAVVACFFCMASSFGQIPSSSPKQLVTLEPPTEQDLPEDGRNAQGSSSMKAPANFRRMGQAIAGEVGPAHTLRLHFTEAATVEKIESTKDFPIEQGGTCAEGGKYPANSSCVLLVRFSPQGPGNRLGRLVLSYSLSSSSAASDSAARIISDAFGLGGYGYVPVINFIPSIINTVPASSVSGKGLLSGASNLFVDGGDTLYVADTGNDLIRSMDSSGKFITISSSGVSAPVGVVADTFGEVFFTEPAQNKLFEIYAYGTQFQLNGSAAGPCTVSVTCFISAQEVFAPAEMATDGYNRIFFADGYNGAAEFISMATSASYAHLYDPFTYQTSPPSALAVDTSDNLYSFWANGVCALIFQTFSDAGNYYSIYKKVAGGKTCGFSGDGGAAGNAEISNSVGQMAFDASGNLYFSDSGNQRVRRIDYLTGTIRTIAGNGSAGHAGDGKQATNAELHTPTGIGVNSLGAVYIISSASSGQVIRQVGPQGYVSFPSQGTGKASSPQSVVVTNTGNGTMELTRAEITGTNAGDFKIDDNTTTCILTAGTSLYSGQTCRIGIIFTPSAAGNRTAVLTLLDNTVNGADTVTLSGTGVLSKAAFTLESPAGGASFESGTAVKFSANVTSTSGKKPTGQIQFKVDGASYGKAVSLSSTGTASASVTGLTVKAHTLAATYSGDSNYSAEGPISVTIAVTAKASLASDKPIGGPVTTAVAAR